MPSSDLGPDKGYIDIRLILTREDLGSGEHGTYITDATHLAHQFPEGITASELQGIRYSIWEDWRELLHSIDGVLKAIPAPKDPNV